MKNKTYTVKFFKDLINKSAHPVDLQRDILEDETEDRNTNDFFTFFFSSPSQNRS
jgi:hypothetical protein